jgi:hypothetical protein
VGSRRTSWAELVIFVIMQRVWQRVKPVAQVGEESIIGESGERVWRFLGFQGLVVVGEQVCIE